MRTPIRLAIALTVGLTSAGCVIHAVPMETRALPERNPTVHSFEMPLEELRTRVMAGLTRTAQRDEPIFGPNESNGGPVTFEVREVGEHSSWLEVMKLPGNERDLYLDADHDPLWESPIYRGPRAGLPFLADFRVHLAESGPSRTSVSVAALETEVLNGSTWGIGSCGPGTFNRYVRVEPTSVEEYVILRRIGAILGVASMPDVILPAR